MRHHEQVKKKIELDTQRFHIQESSDTPYKIMFKLA